MPYLEISWANKQNKARFAGWSQHSWPNPGVIQESVNGLGGDKVYVTIIHPNDMHCLVFSNVEIDQEEALRLFEIAYRTYMSKNKKPAL